MCVYRHLATFYNRSGSYVTPERISKTIGEITGVTSAAVIHSISPSPQQDIYLFTPNQLKVSRVYPSLSFELQYHSEPGFPEKIPSNSSSLLALIHYCLFIAYLRLATLYHLVF